MKHLRALLLALFGCGVSLVLATSSAQAAARIALVVGNSTYEHAPWLSNPANDAKLMAETLSRVGFQVLHRHDLTQAELRRAISEFTAAVAAAGPDSLAFFYYAGHGVQLGGINYLIPVDADIASEREVVLSGVSTGDLLRTLELASASVNVIVLDACRDNPFRQAARGLSLGLARMEAPIGTIIGYATGPGRTATDGRGANSPYTEALAAALVMPGLPIEQVFKQVRRQVYQWTDGAQTPWEESSLIQDVVLTDEAAGPAISTNETAEPEVRVSVAEPLPAAPPREPEPASEAREEQLAAVTPKAAIMQPAAREWPDMSGRVRDFIASYHRAWSGRGTQSAADIAAFYGDTVRYYGNMVSRAEVLRDKSRFAARWPARDYRFEADSLQVSCRGETCSASYRVRFCAQNHGAQRKSSGTAEARVVLAVNSGGLAIIAEDSQVLSRD